MMLYTSVLRDVADSNLMSELGEYRSRGWEVRQLVPTSRYQFPSGAGQVSSVTHWLVVLESGRAVPPAPNEVEIR